jgi:hypothetical protein
LEVIQNQPTAKPAGQKFKKQRNKTRVVEKEEEKESEPEQGPTCDICLETITEKKRSIVPECGHTYHIGCME